MRRKISYFTIMAIIAVYLTACASLQTNTYKTLSLSKVTYDSSMKIAGDLYKQGKITDDQKDRIIHYGNSYKDAHNLAVSSFLKANESGLLSDQQEYISRLANAAIILSDLLNYITKIEGSN